MLVTNATKIITKNMRIIINDNKQEIIADAKMIPGLQIVDPWG